MMLFVMIVLLRRTKMIVEELIKSLGHFDEQEDIKNTFLFTEEKVYQIIIKETENDNS
jgi:hypothetical protein